MTPAYWSLTTSPVCNTLGAELPAAIAIGCSGARWPDGDLVDADERRREGAGGPHSH